MTSLQLGKNNFKAPFFCNATYFIRVRPKINMVTMNTLRGLAEIELDTDQRTGRPLISCRSEVNVLLLKLKRWKKENIIVSSNIFWGGRFHVTIVCFQHCFFPPTLSDTHAHRNAPDGCNWCAGTAAANNCNYQE